MNNPKKKNQMAKKIVFIFVTPNIELCWLQNSHMFYYVIKCFEWKLPNVDVNII
jgi:hypothetical protein